MLNVKCAAVLAKRWQSAARCSTDNVTERMESSRRTCLLLDHLSKATTPTPMVVIAPAPIVICIKKLLLTTLVVIATCYSDLKPGGLPKAS